MRETTLGLAKLFRYSLFFVFISVFISAILLFGFTGDWRVIFDLNVQLMAIKLAFIAVIYIAFPLLIARFCYYFYHLVTHGRKAGISLFCYQTLFNPINFLFRPSLLTQAGLTHRRRCIISLILLTALYGSIFVMSDTN